MAQLMFLLWHGQVECAFVDYFRDKMSDFDSAVEFTVHSVYTLGSICVVSHRSAEWVDHIFGRSIVNLIHRGNPIPRMFSGNKMSPKQPLKVTRKVGFGRMLINQYGQAMMSGFYGVASFGPIGRYIVCVGD